MANRNAAVGRSSGTNNNASGRRRKTPRFDRHPQQVVAVNNLLSAFGDVLEDGFSDDAWTLGARAYRRLAGYLLPAEREILAEAWRDYYVSDDPEAFAKSLHAVRIRL